MEKIELFYITDKSLSSCAHEILKGTNNTLTTTDFKVGNIMSPDQKTTFFKVIFKDMTPDAVRAMAEKITIDLKITYKSQHGIIKAWHSSKRIEEAQS